MELTNRKYAKQFDDFRNDVAQLTDARDAILELSSEIRNGVVLSGEIVGNDTHDRIRKMGEQHGLLVLAQELSVLNRVNQ